MYLDILGFKNSLETQLDLIKQSLNNFYSQFVKNKRNEIDRTLTELLSMFRTAENNTVKA